MIIDIHTHCFPDKLAHKAVPLLAERSGLTPFTDGTIKNLKESMTKADVNISVLQTIATKPDQTRIINSWAAEVQDEQIISFGTIHPDFPDWQAEIRWLIDHGIKGIKLHPDYQDFFVDEPRLFPFYEELFKHQLIVLFHAGRDIGLPEPIHCTPDRLRKVVDHFPGAPMIAAHMGGYQCWEEVRKYLVGTGVYLDTSFSYQDLGPEKMLEIIKNHGPEKILFGTDSPWGDQTEEIKHIFGLNLTKIERQMILGENAQNLLNI